MTWVFSTSWRVADEPPARALTNAELGDLYLRTGDAAAAIAAYRLHLDAYPSDAMVRRSLGVALLSAGRADEAVEEIASAYAGGPWLADEPIRPEAFAQGTDDLALNIELASAYANRVKSAPAWLTAAVLLQGGGRGDMALLMLDRADEAGLDAEVSGRLRAALARG